MNSVIKLLNDPANMKDAIAYTASNLDYNRRFYPGAGYGYDTMKKGSYRLMPTESMMEPLRRDYEHMKDMIFGPIPSFEDILWEIAEVEKELNVEPIN